MIVSRRATLLAALALVLGPARVQAQGMGAIMDAPSAAGLPGAGGLLIDVRTPREQRETGVPKGALRIPLQDDERNFRPSFAQEVLKATGDDPARPIALIDADGRRANYAARLLAAQGLTQAFAVGEGLFGSNLGPGWVARGLPVEACPEC
jgi:rhodanese-related sulfurtransferase